MTARRAPPARASTTAAAGFESRGALLPSRFAATEERLVLHELIRLGVARQEDLRLLQSVALCDASVPASSNQTLLRECWLREEWRCQREQQLLGSLSSTSLASCSESDSQQQLVDQLCALKQIEEEQRAMMVRRATKQNGGRKGPYGSTSCFSSFPPRSPSHGLSQTDRSSRSSTRTPPLQRPDSRPGQPSAGSPSFSLYSGHSAGSLKSTASRDQAARRGSPYNSPPMAKATQRLGTPGGQQQDSRSTGRAAADAGSSSTAGRPISAPHDRPATTSSTSAYSPRSSGGAGRAPSLPKALQPLGQGKGGSEGGSSGGGGSGVRFQQLYHLHGTLLRNLEGHKAASGAGGATSALEANIVEAQELFVRCVNEAAQLVEQQEAEQQAMAEAGTPLRPGTRGGQGRGLSWDRLLRLGQLGLTTADVARLGQLRQAQAARVIQRAVRRWLLVLRHQKAVRAAQQRAAEIRARLRFGAALIIQCWWRGCLARRAAARLRAQAALEQRRARVEALRLNLAASKIQAGYRAHRKRQRARQAMRLQAAPAATAAGAATGRPDAAAAATAGVGPQATGSSGQRPPLAPGQDAEASSNSSPYSAAYANASPLQHSSATRIQAHVRGWLARRSQELWWTRSLAGIRGRRAVAAAWAKHRQRMVQTFGLQQQLVGIVLEEAEMSHNAVRDATRERVEFEGSWGAWLGQQLAAAMSQPLPRGWVPTADPATGNMCFLNTKTGELHAYHPAVQQLRGFVSQQREAAEARQAEREVRVAAHLDVMHRNSLHAQAQLLRSMVASD